MKINFVSGKLFFNSKNKRDLFYLVKFVPEKMVRVNWV